MTPANFLQYHSFRDFSVNKKNRSPLPDASIFTMSNMWVEYENVSSVSIENPLPNIQHLENLNEPNGYIFHPSLGLEE